MRKMRLNGAPARVHPDSWKSMDVAGHPWTSMDIHGRRWTSMGVRGHRATSMDVHGRRWTSMDIDGHPWTSMDIDGHPLTSMDIYGRQWTSMAHGSCYVVVVWRSFSLVWADGATLATFRETVPKAPRNGRRPRTRFVQKLLKTPGERWRVRLT